MNTRYEIFVRTPEDVKQFEHIVSPTTIVIYPNYVGVEVMLEYRDGVVISVSSPHGEGHLDHMKVILRESKAICTGQHIKVRGKVTCLKSVTSTPEDYIRESFEMEPKALKDRSLVFIANDVQRPEDPLALVGTAYTYHGRLLLLQKIGFEIVDHLMTDVTHVAQQINAWTTYIRPDQKSHIYPVFGIVARLYDLDLSRKHVANTI